MCHGGALRVRRGSQAWLAARVVVAFQRCDAPMLAPGCFNTCESGAAAEANVNTCEPGPATAADVNTCELGEGATCGGAAATTPHSQIAECGEPSDGGGTAGATLIAAMQAEGTSAAAVRRHLASLSELAQHPGAAAVMARQGVIAAVGAALVRHGACVAVAASATLALLSAAAVDRGGEGDGGAEDEEGS